MFHIYRYIDIYIIFSLDFFFFFFFYSFQLFFILPHYVPASITQGHHPCIAYRHHKVKKGKRKDTITPSMLYKDLTSNNTNLPLFFRCFCYLTIHDRQFIRLLILTSTKLLLTRARTIIHLAKSRSGDLLKKEIGGK